MAPLPTPPLDASSGADSFSPEGTRPYICAGRKGSLPSSALPSRLDVRRASAPPARELSPVGEFEEDIAPSFWRGDYVAPIGAERQAPNVRVGQGSDIDSEGSNGPVRRAPRINTQIHHLVNYPSASSLSTSSSKLTSHSRSHETTASASWSPIDGDSMFRASTVDTKSGEAIDADPAYPAWRKAKSPTSMTLDFSTGQSIWC
jgi:hypothetical protein